MNILIIAHQEDYKSLGSIIKNLKEKDNNVFLPYSFFDRNYKEETFGNISDVTKYSEKLEHTRQILNNSGKNTIDAALFYNPTDKLENCEQAEIIFSLIQKVPLYIYRKGNEINNFVNSAKQIFTNHSIHSIYNDLDLIEQKKKVR